MTLPQDQDKNKKKRIVTLKSILEGTAETTPPVNLQDIFTPDEETVEKKIEEIKKQEPPSKANTLSKDTSQAIPDTNKSKELADFKSKWIPMVKLPTDSEKIDKSKELADFRSKWIPMVKLPTDSEKIDKSKELADFRSKWIPMVKLPTDSEKIDKSKELADFKSKWIPMVKLPTDSEKIDKNVKLISLLSRGKIEEAKPLILTKSFDDLQEIMLSTLSKDTPQAIPDTSKTQAENIKTDITTTQDSLKKLSADTLSKVPTAPETTKVDSISKLGQVALKDNTLSLKFDPEQMLKNLEGQKTITESISTKVDPTYIIKGVQERERERLQKELELARKKQKEKGIKIRIYDEKGNEYEPYYGVANALTTTIHNLLYPEEEATRPEMAYGTITQALMSGEASVMGIYQSTLDFGDYAYQYLVKPVFGKEPEPERIKREIRETLEKPPVAKITPIIPNKDISIKELYNNVEKDADFDLSFRLNYAKKFFLQRGLNEEQANAIVSALFAESRLNPYAVNPTSGAIGISQWLGDRKYENGKLKIPITGNYFIDFVAQLEYLWNELTTTEKSALDKIKASKSFDEANHYFITDFLRPSHPETLANKRRSRQILKKLYTDDEKYDEKLQSLFLKSFKIENLDEFIEYENKLLQAGKYGQNKIVSLLSAMGGQIDRNLLNDTMSGLASTMIFLPVGFLTRGLAFALTKNISLANTLGAVTSGVYEALNEAGSTYRMIVNDPKLSESSVRSRVLQNFITDAIVTSILDKISWFNEKGAQALKQSFRDKILHSLGDYARVATGETLQEAMQQISQNLATGRPTFEGVKDVILPTIISTVAFRGFMNTINGIERAYNDKIWNLIKDEEIRNIFQDALSKAMEELQAIETIEVDETQAPIMPPRLPAPPMPPRLPAPPMTPRLPAPTMLPTETMGADTRRDQQYYEERINLLNDLAQSHPVKLKINNNKELNDYQNLIYSYIQRDEPIPIDALVYSDDWQIQRELDYLGETVIAPHNNRLQRPEKLTLNLVSKALYGKNLNELEDLNDRFNVFEVHKELYSNNVNEISLTDIRNRYKQYYKIDPNRIQIATKDVFANAIYGLNYSELKDEQKTHINDIVNRILENNQWAVGSINSIREKYYNGQFITSKEFTNKNKISQLAYNKDYDKLNDDNKANVDIFVSSFREGKVDLSSYNRNIFSATDFLSVFNQEIAKISQTASKISLLKGFEELNKMYSKIKRFLYPAKRISDKLEKNEKYFLKRLGKYLYDAGTVEIDLSVLYHFLKNSPKIINTFNIKELDKVAKEVADKINNFYSLSQTKNIGIEPTNISQIIGRTEDAEEIGKETQGTSKEEGTYRGEGERLHIRDTAQIGMETQQGEEKQEGISTQGASIDLSNIFEGEKKAEETTVKEDKITQNEIINELISKLPPAPEWLGNASEIRKRRYYSELKIKIYQELLNYTNDIKKAVELANEIIKLKYQTDLQTSKGKEIEETDRAVVGSRKVILKTPNKFIPIEVKYAVVEADDLITSHKETQNFDPNPDYKSFGGYQPRDRERKVLREQVYEMATNLQPEFLGSTLSTNQGAPVVNQIEGGRFLVESGNGRTMAIRLAYEYEGENYKKSIRNYHNKIVKNPKYLKQLGFSNEQIQKIGRMKKPILVAIRTNEFLDEKQHQEYIDDSNTTNVAEYSPFENAKSDANQLKEHPDLIDSYNPYEDLDSPENKYFVDNFFEKIIPNNEKPKYVDSQGNYNDDLYSRIENALVYYAFQNDKLAIMFLEFAPFGRNIIKAISSVAVHIAKYKNSTFDISKYLIDALNWVFSHSKVKGQDLYETYADYTNNYTPSILEGSKDFIKLDKVAHLLADFLVKYRNKPTILKRFFVKYFQLLNIAEELINQPTLGFSTLENPIEENIVSQLQEDLKNKSKSNEQKVYDYINALISNVEKLYLRRKVEESGVPPTKGAVVEQTKSEQQQIQKPEEQEQTQKKEEQKFEEKPPEKPEKPVEKSEQITTTKSKSKHSYYNRNINEIDDEINELEKRLKELENKGGVSALVSEDYKPTKESKSISEVDEKRELLNRINLLKKIKRIKEFEAKHFNGKQIWEINENEYYKIQKKTNFEFGYNDILDYAVSEGIPEAIEFKKKLSKERAEKTEKINKRLKEVKDEIKVKLEEYFNNYIKSVFKDLNQTNNEKEIREKLIKILKVEAILQHKTLFSDPQAFRDFIPEAKKTLKRFEEFNKYVDYLEEIYKDFFRAQSFSNDNYYSYKRFYQFVSQTLDVMAYTSIVNELKNSDDFVAQYIIDNLNSQLLSMYSGVKEENKIFEKIYKLIGKIENSAKSNNFRYSLVKSIIERLIRFQIYNYVLNTNNIIPNVTDFYKKIGNIVIEKLSDYIGTQVPEVKENYKRLFIRSFTESYNKVLSLTLNELEDHISNVLKSYSKGLLNSGQLVSLARPELKVIGEQHLPKDVKERVTKDKYGNEDFRLDEHQLYGVNLMLHSLIDENNDGFLLGDGTGVGKTAQLLVTAKEYLEHKKQKEPNKKHRVLIVVPNAQIVEGSYKNDGKQLNITFIDASGAKQSDYKTLFSSKELPEGIIIINYNALNTKKDKMNLLLNSEFDLVIYDEAHSLKNFFSSRSMASQLIKAEKRIFVTATPTDKPHGFGYFLAHLIKRKPNVSFSEHLKSVMDAIGIEIYRMNNEYEIYGFKVKGGLTINDVIKRILEERNKLLKKGAYLRREYTFMGNIREEHFDLTEEQKEALDMCLYAIEAYYGDKIGNIILAQQRLLEIVKGNLLADKIVKDIKEDKEGRKFVISATMHSEDIDMTPLENVPSEALELLGIQLKSKLVPTTKFNPFTKRRENIVKLFAKSGLNVVKEKLQNAGIEFVEIYGDNAKAEAISKFKYNDKIKVALMTQASGGAGINLDDHIGNAPRKVWVLGFNWAGDQFEQLMGRFSRKTTRSFAEIVIPLNTAFGIETRLKNKVIEKLALLKSLQIGIDPDEYAIDLSSVASEEIPEEIAISEANRQNAEADNGVSAYVEELTSDETEKDNIALGYVPQNPISQPNQPSLTAGQPQQNPNQEDRTILALQDIAKYLIKALNANKGYSVKTGRKLFHRLRNYIRLKSAVGFYSPKGFVAIKSLQDFYVFLHEFAGHYIEQMFINLNEVFHNQYANEIDSLLNEVRTFISNNTKFNFDFYEKQAKKLYPNDPFMQKVSLHNEMFAEFSSFYIVDPELAQREAPNYFIFYEKMLEVAQSRTGLDVKTIFKTANRLYNQYINMSAQEFISSLGGEAKSKKENWLLNIFSIASIKNLKKNLSKIYEEAIDSLFYFEKLSNALHKVADKINSDNINELTKAFDEAFYKIKGLLGNEGKIKQFLNYNPFVYTSQKVSKRISGLLGKDKYYDVNYEILKQVDGLYHIFKPIAQAGLEDDFNTFAIAMRFRGFIEYINELREEIETLEKDFNDNKIDREEYEIRLNELTEEYNNTLRKIEPLYEIMPIKLTELNRLTNEEKFQRFVDYINETIQYYTTNPAMIEVVRQHEKLMDFMGAIRKYLISTGIISKELAERLRKVDKYYVPFYREFEEEEIIYNSIGAGRYSISNYVGNVVKTMYGSKRLIRPIMENTIQYLSEAIINGERNIALNKLINALDLLDKNLKELKQQAGTDEEAKKVLDALTKEFEQIGIKADVGLVHPLAPPMSEGITFGGERGLYYQIKGDQAEIKIKVNGENKYYVIPKEMFEAFFTVDQIDKPTITMVLLQTIPMIRRMSLTGLNLDFAFSNLISRDVFSALANAKYFINPAGYLKVIADMFGDRELYQDFLISGADLSFLTAIDEKLLKFYDARLFGKNKKYATKMKSYLKNPLLLLRDITIASDLVTRLNVFYNTLIKSGDIGLAMYEARRVTADYGMKGKSKFLHNYFVSVAFLKPNILHTILATKALKNPTKLIIRFLPAVTIPTLLNWALIRLFGDDDDKEYYSRIPVWMKYRFWFVYIKPLHIFIPIPKGNVYAMLFSSPIEALLDFALYNNRLNVKELVGALYDGFAPYHSAQQFIPDVLQIMTIRETGYYGFYENPYIDDIWQKRFPAEYRFDPKTNLLIDNLVTKINLGLEKLKLSPLKTSSNTFQTTLRFLFGDYYDIGTTILEELNIAPNSGNPKLDSYEIFGIDYKAFPIIKRMLKPKFPKIKSEDIVRFYDKLSTLENEYRGLINRLGNPSTENLDQLYLKKYRDTDGSAKDLSVELGVYLHYSKDFNTLRRFLSTMKIFRQYVYSDKGEDALPLILTLDAVVYDATVDFMKNFERAKQQVQKNGSFSDLPLSLLEVDPMDYRMFAELVDQYVGYITEIDKSVIKSEYPEYIQSLEFQKDLYKKSAEELEKTNKVIFNILKNEMKKYREKYGEKTLKGGKNEG